MDRRSKLLIVAAAIACATAPTAAQRARAAMDATPAGNPANWFPQDDYPPEAIRAHRSGRVVAAVGVSAKGIVTTCTIEQSSGTTSLDEKTCELARLRGSFDPATDEHGISVASIYRMPVKWVMPDRPDASIDLSKGGMKHMSDVEVTVGADGIIERCRVLKAVSLAGEAGPCQPSLIGKSAGHLYARDGVPVRTIVRQTTTESVEPVPAKP